MGLLKSAGIDRAVNGQGAPVPRAKRHVFAAQSETLCPIYRDSDLTVMHANPMVADVNGFFELGYVLDGEYRIVIEAPDGASLFEADGVAIGSAPDSGEVRSFGTVQDLVADTLLSYAKGTGKVRVSAGSNLRVAEGGFTYRIAAPGAGDHHLETAGGVKLYVVPLLAGSGGGIWSLAAFDIDLTGAVNESAKVQAVMDAAAGGGVIFHPGGTVLCDGITGRAGVTLDGANRFTSVWKRDETGAKTLIEWQDAEAQNVTVTNVGIDVATQTGLTGGALDQGGAGDFVNGLKFDDFRPEDGVVEFLPNRIVVERCHLFDSNKESAGNWTITGITARGCNDVLITGNVTDGVQIKAGGGALHHRKIKVTNNVMSDVRAYGISLVISAGAAETKSLVDVDASGNTIRGGYRAPAIYVGLDSGSGGDILLDNVRVSGNVIHATDFSGQVGENFAFIFVRGGSADNNILVDGNVCASGTVTTAANTGIKVSAENATVSNNRITASLDTFAISCSSNSASLTGNTISGANRGILVEASAAATVSAVGNTFRGDGVNTPRFEIDANGNAVHLHLVGNSFLDCAVASNKFNSAPFTFKCDGGSLSGLVANNTIADLGNTDHCIDENEQSASVWDVRFVANYFGPAKVFKRQNTPDANLFHNLGGGNLQTAGAFAGATDFVTDAVFRNGLLLDGDIPEPSPGAGHAAIYIDSVDGNLKVKFANGTVQTVATA